MNPLIQSFLFVLTVGLLAWPIGHWLACILRTRRIDPFLEICLGNGIHRSGSWKSYFVSLLGFNAVMFVITWLVLANQQHLPLNPDGMKSMPWHLVFNTTASFVTNTNLQHYSGEATLSYFSQLTLMWLQFTSAATGIAAFAALARGLSGSLDVGNFGHDTARILLLFLLPLATTWAIAYTLCGVPMTLEGTVNATTLEGASQSIARGPVAAFLAIKHLGTNGGGFFGVNVTHPFESPNLIADVLSMIAIPIIPMACVLAFGSLIGNPRHARVIGAVMLAFLLIKLVITVLPESAPTAVFHDLPVAASANLEGKEVRFDPATGSLWAVLTTCTSNGSVGAMHDSFNPLSLLGPFSGLWLNSTFGGVGVGIINFFLFMILAVFVAGLMVGRTPEYLGKKVEAREMMLASAAFIVHPLLILTGTALFSFTSMGEATIHNAGPRGFSEILYEFSSAAANNGSGLEGLGDATAPWNIATGIVMLLGRFLPIVLPLAIIGSLAAKPRVAESSGTLRTDTPTFGVMVFAVILFLGALTFLPVALLGPVLEHLSFNF